MNLTIEECDKNKATIVALLHKTARIGMDEVIHYLYESGFFIVPSFINRHHNWRGGLAQHSLGVYLTAKEHGEGLPEDSLIIAGLLHDICKARKLYYDENGIIHHRHTHIHGHGYRSIKILEECGLELTEEERLAIRWHMGGHHAKNEEVGEVKKARNMKLWHVIHHADHWDAAGKNLKVKRMKYCSHCGHPNQYGALFCGACGKQLSQNTGSNVLEAKALIPLTQRLEGH